MIFPLISEMILICEIYITSFSISAFDASLNFMPYVKSKFKKDNLLILAYSELLWYNWEPG